MALVPISTNHVAPRAAHLIGGDRHRPALRADQLVRPPAGPARALKWTAILLVLSLGVGFLPWQQSVRGKGDVTTLRPEDRPQQVPAVVGGRIAEWLVAEGEFVRRGQPLLRLQEAKTEYLDPQTLERMREQLAAKEASNAAKRDKAVALAAQLVALEQGLALSLDQARNSVAQREAALEAATADSVTAQDQYARRELLHRDGLVSLNDLQNARLKWQAESAELAAARNALANARIELASLGAEYAEKLAKVRSDRSATLAEVSDGEAEVAKLRNSVASLDVRNSLFTITAPQDGYVVTTLRAGIGEQVKEGDAVLTVMPQTARPAVALNVTATDVPLLTPGDKVRLQFDGWPALQFSGWPSVAVGTFGGEIAVVDQVARPDGTYRVLVREDPADEAWPNELRLGSGVIGWAMLDEVSLARELWRRLNGFPPAVDAPPSGASSYTSTK